MQFIACLTTLSYVEAQKNSRTIICNYYSCCYMYLYSFYMYLLLFCLHATHHLNRKSLNDNRTFETYIPTENLPLSNS